MRKRESPAVASLHKMQQVGGFGGSIRWHLEWRWGWHLGWQIVSHLQDSLVLREMRACCAQQSPTQRRSISAAVSVSVFVSVGRFAVVVSVRVRGWLMKCFSDNGNSHIHIHIPSSRQSEAAPPCSHTPSTQVAIDLISFLYIIGPREERVLVVLPLLRCHGISSEMATYECLRLPPPVATSKKMKTSKNTNTLCEVLGTLKSN